MTPYFEQLDNLEPRKGQTSAQRLKARLGLIATFVKEFHKKFVTTHKEELGEMAEVEATQLANEHFKNFTTFYTEKRK